MPGWSLAISTQHSDADLAQLVHAVMEPWLEETSAISLDGQGAIALLPRQVMSLGMILHELATNAIKHGALSVQADTSTSPGALPRMRTAIPRFGSPGEKAADRKPRRPMFAALARS